MQYQKVIRGKYQGTKIIMTCLNCWSWCGEYVPCHQKESPLERDFKPCEYYCFCEKLEEYHKKEIETWKKLGTTYIVPNQFKESMLKKCPKCGRQGYQVIKKVTNQYHTRQYAIEYFKHNEGRPIWCYIKRIKEKDGSPNDWDWSIKENKLGGK